MITYHSTFAGIIQHEVYALDLPDLFKHGWRVIALRDGRRIVAEAALIGDRIEFMNRFGSRHSIDANSSGARIAAHWNGFVGNQA